MTNQDKKENPSALSLVKDFGDSTSMHGIGRALNSNSLWKRLVWTILIVCGAGFLTYQLVDIVKDFYTYPVTTVVSLQHESKLQFPAITICNMNPMRSSMIPEEIKEDVLLKQKERGDYWQDEVRAIVRSVEKDVREKAAHELENMLISCLYNRNECWLGNFYDLGVDIYGKCFTFFYSEGYITKPGPQNGLILEMAIQYNEYTSLASQAGVKVIVHEQDEVPFPEDGGILVPPGMSTQIAIKKTVTRRLPAPYGKCIPPDGENSAYLSLFDSYNYSYTETACKKSCYQLTLILQCKCCDTYLFCVDDRVNEILQLNRPSYPFPYCNTSSVHSKCFSKIEESFLNGNLECFKDCAPSCNQTMFDTTVSTGLWPSDPYIDVLMAQAESTALKNITFDSRDDVKRFISNNMLRLEIFYEKMDFLEISTKPMYSWINLFGTMGGLLGLWLGFSALTAFEVIELCIDLVALCGRKLHRTVVDK